MGEKRNAHRILPEGKRPLGRPICGWIVLKMIIGVIGSNGMDWIDLAKDRDL
jgi:hypothetical protein